MNPETMLEDAFSAMGRQPVANRVSGAVMGNVIQAGVINEVTIVSPAPPAELPRQLPSRPHLFIDRPDRSERLDEIRARALDEGRPAIAVITGMGGVGKTTCAVAWCRRNAEHFPGGQLYADLSAYRGRDGVAITDVAAAFLRALGVHSQYIPTELPERVALFRSVTARAGVLVLIDDADAPAQVRALVPGSPGSMVVVTSRLRLGGLVLDGAETVELSPMAAGEGVSLISNVVRDGRAEQDPAAVLELVRLCAGLPIALRVAAAELARRRTWPIARFVRHLSDDRERLRRLAVGGDNLVERVFDAAYENLSPSARRLFRVLGLHPGPDFGKGVAAAAAEISREQAEDLVDTLDVANLVEEPAPERYRFHDLVRLHAYRRAEREETAKARAEIERRIVQWYLLGAAAADRAVLGESRWRIASHDVKCWDEPFTPASGMAWFDTERANLVAAVRLAYALDLHDAVWQFCEALWAFYHSRKHYADWIETHRLGAESALRENHGQAEARVRNQLARAYIETHDFEQAKAELARVGSTALGDERSRAMFAESRGLLYREQGRYEEAAEAFHDAQEVHRLLGNQRGDGLQGYQFGDALVRAGQPAEALPVLERALALLTEVRDEMAVARVQIAMGRAYERLNRSIDARRVLERALIATRERSQPVKEAQALEVLVNVAERDQDGELFRDSAARLYRIYREAGSPRSTEVGSWVERGHR